MRIIGYFEQPPTAFACNLTEDNPNLNIPWEYETLLEFYKMDDGLIRTEQIKKREAGLLKFICEHCAKTDHENCIGLLDGDQSWCDCQHKGSTVAK
jgi:hypothetical protein